MCATTAPAGVSVPTGCQSAATLIEPRVGRSGNRARVLRLTATPPKADPGSEGTVGMGGDSTHSFWPRGIARLYINNFLTVQTYTGLVDGEVPIYFQL